MNDLLNLALAVLAIIGLYTVVTWVTAWNKKRKSDGKSGGSKPDETPPRQN